MAYAQFHTGAIQIPENQLTHPVNSLSSTTGPSQPVFHFPHSREAFWEKNFGSENPESREWMMHDGKVQPSTWNWSREEGGVCLVFRVWRKEPTWSCASYSLTAPTLLSPFSTFLCPAYSGKLIPGDCISRAPSPAGFWLGSVMRGTLRRLESGRREDSALHPIRGLVWPWLCPSTATPPQ